MGRGPSENANGGKGPVCRKLLDWEAAKQTGTLAQFLKLRKYKKAVVSQTSPIPVGVHPELDSLENVLKAGAKVAFRAQIAIFLPCLFGMVLFLTSFGVVAVVIPSLAAEGMESQEIILEYGYLVQVLMVLMVLVCVMLPASLQPSDVTGITIINGGVATSMIGCAFVLCPVLMPLLFPDKSGGSRLSYSICGYIKCVLLSLTCFYSLIFLPPRRALRLAEIGLSSVGFGFVPFAVWAAISSVTSAGLQPTTGFYVSWAVTVCLCLTFATLALLGYPRTLSKRILKCLNAWLIPDVSEEAGVLHATIATMVGSPFRAVASDALSKLRCVSLADVTLEEFSFNRPDPQCYLKSKECKFKEIDFFVSHSWSDNPEVKWEVIQRVREEFKAQNGGREPLIWFDKYCLNQGDIDNSVRMLPLYLCACRKMLILLGPSYMNRMWCMLELFVFTSCLSCGLFGKTDVQVERIALDDAQLAELANDFSIRNCRCYRDGDKQTILGVVETGAGDGILGFNSAVRMLINSEDGPEVVPTSKTKGSKASLSAAQVHPAAKGFTGAEP